MTLDEDRILREANPLAWAHKQIQALDDEGIDIGDKVYDDDNYDYLEAAALIYYSRPTEFDALVDRLKKRLIKPADFKRKTKQKWRALEKAEKEKKASSAKATTSRSNGPHTGTGTAQTPRDDSNEGSNILLVRTIDELYASAKEIIESGDVLAKVEEAVPQLGYAGDRRPVLLTYATASSRLLAKPINEQLLGPSAAGKNFTINTALRLIPDDAVFKMSASSPKALIYSDVDLRHKTVVLAEGDSIMHLEGNAATLVRSIIEDSRTDFDVVEKDPETGRNVTRRVTKEGPTGLITTGVRDFEIQIATRILTVVLLDTPAQTGKVLEAEAAIASGEANAVDPELIAKFQDFQRWLAAQPEPTVIVPFAKVLAKTIPHGEVRMRRDFKQLLSVIMAIALLNRARRDQDAQGRIIAALEDYDWARRLSLSAFKSIVGGGITDAIRETVAAVPEGQEVSEADLVRTLNLTKSTINYRVRRALRGGWLRNLETRKFYPARLVLDAPLPEDGEDVSPLPSLEKLKSELAAFEPPTDSNPYSNPCQPLGGEGLTPENGRKANKSDSNPSQPAGRVGQTEQGFEGSNGFGGSGEEKKIGPFAAPFVVDEEETRQRNLVKK